jgi:Helix-turn-helix domain
MDDTLCRRFFEKPSRPPQRQYEALRAVFLDGLSQQEAAARFGYSYDAFRQLVRQFRRGCAAGIPPPFSSRRDPGGPRPPRPRRFDRSGRPSPTPAPWAWPPAAASARAWPEPSSSCPCSPACASTGWRSAPAIRARR